MPLTPRFSWEQDDASIALQISLPGAALKDADIYLSDLVFKINAPPYVLMLDLCESIDYASAIVKRNALNHQVHVTINKAVPKIWKQLCHDTTKNQLKERRLASMERKRNEENLLVEQRKDRKYQEEKQTLRAQMAVDETNRQILADLKAEEKAREEEAMYDSFRKLGVEKRDQDRESRVLTREGEHVTTKCRHSPLQSPYHKDECYVKVPDTIAHLETSPAEVAWEKSNAIVELDTCESCSNSPETLGIREEVVISGLDPEVDINHADGLAVSKSQVDRLPFGVSKDVEVEINPIPPPRPSAQTEIHFTPRLFPTPSRESKAAEEEDWMLKNRKHLKKHKGLRGATEAYDISESDPAWLKAKGDDFYCSLDFRSALNAYTEAVSALDNDQNELLTSCLSNRAACHLQLSAFKNCLDDCTTALSFVPDTPASAGIVPSSQDDDHARIIREFGLKLKLLVRRGTAFCCLGKFTEAKADYGVALTMDKQNSALKHDYHQLLLLEKSMQIKESGDNAFKAGRLHEAIVRYGESLELNPHSIACLSNRAACYLRRHEHQQCVDDCTTALQLLQQDPAEMNGSSVEGIAFSAVGPPPGSAKRREWVIKTLVRRGIAQAAMKHMEQAKDDYAAAVTLDPSNKALVADLNKIREEMEKEDTRASKTVAHEESTTVLSVP